MSRSSWPGRPDTETMSRIDDALTRATGKPAGTPKPSVFPRVVSEGAPTARPSLRGDDRQIPGVSDAAREAPVEKTRLESSSPAPSRRRLGTNPAEPRGSQTLVNYVGFAWRALRRRKVLVIMAFLLTFSLTIAATSLVPRTYEIEVKLLAQRSGVMASLSNPGRAVPYDSDAPTRAAAETVLRRDNILSLIRQTDLINTWTRTRAPILRLGDRLKALILRRQLTPDDTIEEVVSQIEKRMIVSARPSGDGLVTIYLTWPDAHAGYLLVERAQQAFIEARRVAETQAIAEAIALLERHAESLNRDVKVTLAELTRTQALVEEKLPPARRTAQPGFVERALTPPDPLEGMSSLFDDLVIDPASLNDPRLSRLKSTIAAKRFELSRLEEEQKRKLADLQAQLAVARTIYTPSHPTVLSLQQSATNFQHSSPQIVTLRNELDRLETEADDQAASDAERLIRATLSKRGGLPPPRVPRPAPIARTEPVPAPEPETPAAEPRRDAVAEFATLRLRTELNQLRSILERTDSARIELAVSQAAFKYRYTIVQPAEEPRDPSFPDTRPVLLAGFLASILFAMVAAIAADIMSNRILEPWQVPQRLGLTLLGRVSQS